MKLQPNILVKQRELKPVTTKGKYYYNDGSLGRLLKNIKRHTLTDRILICAAVSPDNSKGIFLDDKGHEYLISAKDLNSDLKYISSKFVKKQDKKFVGVKRYSSKYNLVMRKFLERPDVQLKYKDWSKSSIGTSPSIQINEENTDMYEVGKCYLADDGDWSFKVLSKTKNYIQIQDLSNNKKYKVEISDLELTNPSELNEESDRVSKDIKKITKTLKNKCDNVYYSLGSIHDAAINLKKYGRDYNAEGELDRRFLDGLVSEAKKVYNYYLVSVKTRLKDLDLTSEDKEYINDMISEIDEIRKWNLETIDLDKLQNRF